MSSKKTAHYRLHSWEAPDDFLRAEMNENFTKLDEALHSGLTAGSTALQNLIVAGSYTGDGADTRTIQLGFTPRLVFVMAADGQIYNGAYTYGGIALKNLAGAAVAVVEGGFSVRYHDAGRMLATNGSKRVYFYWALQ